MCYTPHSNDTTPAPPVHGMPPINGLGADGGLYFYAISDQVRLNKIVGDDVLRKAINQVHNNGKVSKGIDKKLFIKAYEPLKQAVNEGFGKVVTKVKWGTPDFEFLKQLQYNAASFSAFKKHAEVKDMISALKDEQGNRRSKEDFIREALKVDDQYNVRHLSVEYDMAVRQSRAASQWQRALSTKDLYPNIEYLPSVSANPREDHAQWYGIVRPIEDWFWDENLPPSDWGCKCGWRVSDKDITDIPDNLPPVNEEFAFNPGKTGQVFDLEMTGYNDTLPAKEKVKLIADAIAHVNWDMAANQPYVAAYKSKAGTIVKAHPVAMMQREFAQNLNYARQIANSAQIEIDKIKIPPELLPDVAEQKALRGKLLPGVKGDHNPDYLIDGKYADLKTFKNDVAGKKTIMNTISKAHEQADGAVLIVKENFIELKELYRQIYLKFMHEEYEGFKLFLFFNGEWKYFTRSTFLKFYKK